MPASRSLNLFTTFVQDEVRLNAERLRLTLGTKFEHNAYSGFQTQPSARLVWTATPNHTFVASVSRSVRTPTRVEREYETNSLIYTSPAFLRLIPNPNFVPEKLIAYEAGYRVRPLNKVYVTASLFANQHDDILSTAVTTPYVEPTSGQPRTILPLHWNNDLHGNSHGAEVTADYRPFSWWRWTGGYSNLTVQLSRDAGKTDLSQERTAEGNIPRHQLNARWSFDLSDKLDLDWTFRYVSRLRNLNIPAYATSDVRLAWRLALNLELSIVGRNLHDPSHPQYTRTAEIPRSVFAQAVFRIR